MVAGLTVGFDWRFWSVGVLRDFADVGLTIVLVGPLRVNLLRGDEC